MKVSISKLKLFKACRRAYYFKYVEGLEPITKSSALETGTSYHEKIEELYRTGKWDNQHTKEDAMAVAHYMYLFTKRPYNVEPEKWVSYQLSNEDELIGRVDGIAESGILIEHKTTSGEITEEYEYKLQHDEQILAYMLMTGARTVFYTVCRKPTIRQKKGESDYEFYTRMLAWYTEDTDKKIRCYWITKTDEEVQEFLCNLLDEIQEMKGEPTLYRNTLHCTCWGRECEYASICYNYDPAQQYVGFIKGD